MTDVLSLKKANCKNCHKCIRSCPVKSIRFADNQAKIIPEECILCGRCVVVCPQNAKRVRSDLTEVIGAVGSGKRVIATLAPSFISEFPVSGIGEMEGCLKKLGCSPRGRPPRAPISSRANMKTSSATTNRRSSSPPAATRSSPSSRSISRRSSPVSRR